MELYRCSCSRIFIERTKYDDHVQVTRHESVSYNNVNLCLDDSKTCPTCGIMFATEDQLSDHQETRRHRVCGVCRNGFWSDKDFNSHLAECQKHAQSASKCKFSAETDTKEKNESSRGNKIRSKDSMTNSYRGNSGHVFENENTGSVFDMLVSVNKNHVAPDPKSRDASRLSLFPTPAKGQEPGRIPPKGPIKRSRGTSFQVFQQPNLQDVRPVERSISVPSGYRSDMSSWDSYPATVQCILDSHRHREYTNQGGYGGPERNSMLLRCQADGMPRFTTGRGTRSDTQNETDTLVPKKPRRQSLASSNSLSHSGTPRAMRAYIRSRHELLQRRQGAVGKRVESLPHVVHVHNAVDDSSTANTVNESLRVPAFPQGKKNARKPSDKKREGQTMYKCTQCAKEFDSNAALKQHAKDKHQEATAQASVTELPAVPHNMAENIVNCSHPSNASAAGEARTEGGDVKKSQRTRNKVNAVNSVC